MTKTLKKEDGYSIIKLEYNQGYRTRENASEPMWFRGAAAFIVGFYPKIFFRSSSGVLIGAML